MSNSQIDAWAGDFGKEYTNRNAFSFDEMEDLYLKLYGVKRTEMNRRFLEGIDKSIKILEVGANVGDQLNCLQVMGYKDLHGIEINKYALELAKKRTKDIDFVLGSALDMPFEDGEFDLVYTSGVLIHISPENIKKVLSEIHRCAKKYIWGLEYFSEKYVEVPYRDKKNLLWKGDFAKMYLNQFNDLELVKEERYKYVDSDEIDSMFLLGKKK